jgi:predicted enzyme related to lactoylglutathione lyase
VGRDLPAAVEGEPPQVALRRREGRRSEVVMVERTSYEPGTPSWVDVNTPDTQAAVAFYGALFGWAAEMDPRPEAGGYGLFTLRGKRVAGLGPQMNPEMPPVWNVYVTVTDVDASLQQVKEAGGTVVAGPIDVFDAGRMGVIQDPNGSYISLWQPGQTIGCELVNEPGTFGWNELATSDLAGAREFYQSLFGWGLDPNGSSDTAAMFTVDGKMVCGAHTAGEGEFPAWSVWFTVTDCDQDVARVTELGGAILVPPFDMGFGRGAVVADPQGAAFGIAAVDAPAEEPTS